MRTIPRCLARAIALPAAAVALCTVAASANAITVNFRTDPLVLGDSSITAVADGVSIRATAWQVDFTGGTTSSIYGPFTTGGDAFRGIQVFGTCTRRVCDVGLGLNASVAMGQSDFDTSQFAGIEPGFDNMPYLPGTLPSTQFALFEFSAPVDVSAVTVDQVSNFGRSIWAAGGVTAPSFSSGLLSAFAGFDVTNSLGRLGGLTQAHAIAGLNGIRYLAVGAPTPPEVGAFGPFASVRGTQFYIEALTFAATPGLPPDPEPPVTPSIPEPQTYALMLAGLVAVGAVARRRVAKRRAPQVR